MAATSERKHNNLDLDTAGTTASLLCAVHCALMPMIVTILPLIGLEFLASETVDYLLLGLSALLGWTSLCFGYRIHRRGTALTLLATGLALLTAGHLSEEHGFGKQGVALVVVGGITVAASHILNRKLCKACRACTTNSRISVNT